MEIKTIIRAVSDHYKIPIDKLLSRTREREIVEPRQMAMYITGVKILNEAIKELEL